MITHWVTVLHDLEKWPFHGFWIISVWWKWCFTAEMEGKGGASRQIQSNAANVTGDSVGLCFLSWGPKCFCKSQRTAEHAAIMSLTAYQELAPKLTCCILNSPLFFLTIGKKFLLPFYEVNSPLVLACVHLLAYMQGRSLSVPSCAWQHMCHQSHGCWALLCCVGHIAMTEG